MPSSPPFDPPSPNAAGKPTVPAWVPPPITKQTDGFATLKSIDLSKMDSDDPKVVAELVEEVKVAIRDDGFIFLENYGISYEQVSDSTYPSSWIRAYEVVDDWVFSPIPVEPPVLLGSIPLQQHQRGRQGATPFRPRDRSMVGLQTPVRFQEEARGP
jgi:hypothetical protein